MGAVHSDLKSNIVQASGTTIPQDDTEFWQTFWQRPETVEHVFETFSASDIRRMRDDPQGFQNLETLVFLTAERILLFRCNFEPGSVTQAPMIEEHMIKEVMNCIRILSRVLPYIYESEDKRKWEEGFFWREKDFNKKFKLSKSRTKNILDRMAEFVSDERHSPATSARHDNGRQAFVPTQHCLGVQLVNALVDLLFHDDLTIPAETFGGDPHPIVSYQIWQSGIARKAVISSRECESRRTEILQLLLTMQSKSIYMTRDELLQYPVEALECVAYHGDNMRVLTLLVSLLNTVLKYHPNTWIPLDPRNSDASKENHIRTCLHFLLVNLLHRVPCRDDVDVPQTNHFRKNFRKLHDARDFQHLTDGILKILRQPSEVALNVLAKSQRPVTWAHEMLLLLWEALADNKRYRAYVIDTNRALDMMIMLIYYAIEAKTEGVLRVSVFCLMSLSQEPGFAASLNRPFESHDALPAIIQIKNFHGSYADYLIMSLLSLVGDSPTELSVVAPSLLAVISNISPRVINLGRATSVKLVHTFAWMSTPAFVLGSEQNAVLLGTLMRSINSLIEFLAKGHENENIIYAVWRSQERFVALDDFCNASEEEFEERQRRQRKFGSNEDGSNDIPGMTRGMGKMQVSHEDGDANTTSSDTPASPPEQPISEKAQGKRPQQHAEEKSPAEFSFPDTSASWLPNLPRHTTLMLIDQLNTHIATLDLPPPTTTNPSPRGPTLAQVLSPIRTAGTTNIPASEPVLAVFTWQPEIIALYASFYWGIVVSKDIARASESGNGVWAGTEIRLFTVRQGSVQQPSLWSPKGAVDLVGENLVSVVRSAAGRMVG